MLRGLLGRRALSTAYEGEFKLIEETVKSNPVVLFMKGTAEAPLCGYSRTLCQVLRQYPKLARFTTVNVLADERLRAALKEYSKWPTFPQLYLRGSFVGGCDIVYDMYKTGQLEQLFEESNVFEK